MTDLIKQARELCKGEPWSIDTAYRLAYRVPALADALEEAQGEIERLKGAVQEWKDGKCISQKYLSMIGELTARAERAEKERDELKALCRPVCPVCGIENDRHFQVILCDRCGANLRGPQEEE